MEQWELGLAQSTVSKHLACLRDCDLIDYRAEGRQSFYSLTRPELMDLLASAEHLLAATCHAVVLCPVHGTQPRAQRRRPLPPAADSNDSGNSKEDPR